MCFSVSHVRVKEQQAVGGLAHVLGRHRLPATIYNRERGSRHQSEAAAQQQTSGQKPAWVSTALRANTTTGFVWSLALGCRSGHVHMETGQGPRVVQTMFTRTEVDPLFRRRPPVSVSTEARPFSFGLPSCFETFNSRVRRRITVIRTIRIHPRRTEREAPDAA